MAVLATVRFTGGFVASGPNLERLFEAVQILPHHFLELFAVFRQPRLPPDVGDLGDDTAVGLEMPFQGVKVMGEGHHRRLGTDLGPGTTQPVTVEAAREPKLGTRTERHGGGDQKS